MPAAGDTLLCQEYRDCLNVHFYFIVEPWGHFRVLLCGALMSTAQFIW